LAPVAEEEGENGGGFAEVDVRAPQMDIFDPEIGTRGMIHFIKFKGNSPMNLMEKTKIWSTFENINFNKSGSQK
jgi:hypothetical protein